MWVRGHSMSLKMVPFKSLGTLSYSPSITTMAASLAISEIFSIKKWPDLEIWVTGNSKSLKLVPFETFGAISYSPSIVTITPSFIVCEIYWIIGQKSQNFYTPLVFSAHKSGDPVGILQRCFILIQLEWSGYRVVTKLWQYIKPFPQNTGMWRTDRQTDRWTDGWRELLYQYRTSAHWRAIKILVLLRLSSLRFLLRYFGIIVSYIYHDNCCACGTIYSLGTFEMQARSIHQQSAQVSAHFSTCSKRRDAIADPGWAASPRKTPQLPLK